MKYQIFVVHDTVSKIFLTPFYQVNDAVAKRNFASAANDRTTDIGQNPSDFHLYHLGTFDNETAETVLGQLTSYGPASNYVKG